MALIPLKEKPNCELTEISRQPMGDSWDLVFYDAQQLVRCCVQMKGSIQRNWCYIPDEPEEES